MAGQGGGLAGHNTLCFPVMKTSPDGRAVARNLLFDVEAEELLTTD